jgi:hypothetical protein
VQQVNADGTVGCGAGPLFSGWGLTGNAGTDPATNFIGTTDAQPFVVRTQNVQSLRIEPSTILFGGDPITANVIAGSSANNVTAGVRGATIAGGGVPVGNSDPNFSGEAPNRVTDAYGTVGGGYANRAGDDAGSVTNGAFATVGGGQSNIAASAYSTVGGGQGNTAGNTFGTVSGGSLNTASGSLATVSGGNQNLAFGNVGTVGGGQSNVASGDFSTVVGGFGNFAHGVLSTVSGGERNCAGGNFSWAGGYFAKVRPGSNPGGSGSCSGLTYPGGGGDQGTFVWADSQSGSFVSTGSNQFLVRADGGFGFNVNEIPAGVEAVFRSRGSGDQSADLYLRTATHGRGINLTMVPGTGAAEFRIAQFDGTSATDRVVVASNGDFTITAQAFKPGGGLWAMVSDARLKANVEPIVGTLDRLLMLRGVRFEYRPEVTPKAMYLPGPQIGFIAQEVERVFPDWVSEGPDGYKTVGARGFEALTVEALRELRAESAAIDGGQSARIAALEAENAELRAGQTRVAAENAALRTEAAQLRAESDELRARLERLESLIAGRAGEER